MRHDGVREDLILRAAGLADWISAVSLQRLSQVIVDQIRLLIQQGRLKPGDRLPDERDLSARFGVSRFTVREARRILAAAGLVKINLGVHGGAFVTAPSYARVSARLADLFQLSPLTADQVTEARIVLEVGIVPLVVERAKQDDIAALQEICARQRSALADGAYSVALSAEFHVRVAACTQNVAVEMLVQSFREPTLASLSEADAVTPLMGHRGNAEHQAFVDAVQRGDVADATKIMREHLERTR